MQFVCNHVLLEKVWHSQKRFAKLNSQFLWSLGILLLEIFRTAQVGAFVIVNGDNSDEIDILSIGTICIPFRFLISIFQFRTLCAAKLSFLVCFQIPGLLSRFF